MHAGRGIKRKPKRFSSKASKYKRMAKKGASFRRVRSRSRSAAAHLVSDVSKLKRIVKDVARHEKALSSSLVYRKDDFKTITSGVYECAFGYEDGNIDQQLDNVLQQLVYFDPNTPGVLQTPDQGTQTRWQKWLFDSVWCKFLTKNNYESPVHATVYVCEPKIDNTIVPTTLFSNGLVDVGNPGVTPSNLYLSDSKEFMRYWKVVRTVKRYLQPGQEFTVSHGHKNFCYEPAVQDSEANAYKQAHRSFIFMVRIVGSLAHDSAVANQLGLQKVAVDTMITRSYKLRYDGGTPMENVHLATSSTGTAAPTNGFVSNINSNPQHITYALT